MPFAAPELQLAVPQQNPQQAFSLCGNLPPAGPGEPEELGYSQDDISKNMLYTGLL